MEETLLEAESDGGNTPVFAPILGQGCLIFPPQQ